MDADPFAPREQPAFGAQPIEPLGDPYVPGPPPGPRGFTILAWIGIVIVVVGMIAMNQLATLVEPEETNAEDTLGVMMMEVQGRYMVWAGDMTAESELLYEQAQASLNVGSVGQRQRFVILAGELSGPESALSDLADLEDLAANEAAQTANDDEPFELTADQVRVNGILRLVYGYRMTVEGLEGMTDADDATADVVEAIGPDDRDFLEEQLGWFGQLALLPPSTVDEDDRAEMIAPAERLGVLVVSGFVAGAAGGIIGLASLVIFIVLCFSGRIRSRIDPSSVHPGIYAETFALWLLLFIGLQIPAGVLGVMAPNLALLFPLGAFFMSLVALGWPVLRGVPWAQVRRDVGLTAGSRPALEPAIGLLGYLMALPMLGVGLAFTLVLLFIQAQTTGEPPAFGSSAGPAHPIIEQLSGSSWTPKILVLLLAAVAAPIVEETMFRGVLYRHLRDVSRGLGMIASIAFSTALSGFIFAAIHPQGWVAIPALASLACGFVLVREWRGTIIPSMVVHATSNGLVMCMLIAALNM